MNATVSTAEVTLAILAIPLDRRDAVAIAAALLAQFHITHRVPPRW